MKPVNLIPSEQRRATPKDGGGIPPRVGLLLGGLGVAVVAVLSLVLVNNQVNAKNDELARTVKKEQAAQTASQALQPYGDFVKVSEERLATVTSLEDTRFNWERTVRQLSHVIAPGVWISSFKGTVDAGSGSGSGGGGSGVRGSINGPAIELSGCSPSQETVARMMARMRNMDGATEVVASRSEKGSAGAGASGGGDSGGEAGGCPIGYYSFDLTVGLNGGSNAPPAAAAATGPGAAASGAADTAAAQSSGSTGSTGSTATTGGTP